MTFHSISRRCACYCIETSLRRESSSSAFPAPITTAVSGSSATTTGSPVSSRRRMSKLRRRAPPPANTIPLSTISDESSGGVHSNATFTAYTIWFTGSIRLSAICFSDKPIVWYKCNTTPCIFLSASARTSVLSSARSCLSSCWMGES